MEEKLAKLLVISTYKHFDGYHILIREDTGQEVSMKELELLKNFSMEVPSIKRNSFEKKYIEIRRDCVPKGANSIVYLDRKNEENSSVRGIYYGKMHDFTDDGIRSFLSRKIFG